MVAHRRLLVLAMFMIRARHQAPMRDAARIGQMNMYFHAPLGGLPACFSQNNHVCVERAMHQNCPVCFEFLFESVDPTTVLRCGHTIHSQCLSVSEQRNWL